MEDRPLPHSQQPSGTEEVAFFLNFENWEGPLDLLLILARQQKVDLQQISILELVEQYLRYINKAHDLKLEVAADYLVMAAWLAYLKSALLLPKLEDEAASPDELALRLQSRLQRLDAMRQAGAQLMARDRIGRDNFLRGRFEGLRDVKNRRWDVALYDMFHAYGQVRLRTDPVVHKIARQPVISLERALDNLQKSLGSNVQWHDLTDFIPDQWKKHLLPTAIASSFLAALELAKQGRIELQQQGDFSALYVRALQP